MKMTLLQNHVKVALRNLWKFKIQTVVCVLGLSVGMACFALGTLWLRYIESFEDFVPDAENVYFVTAGDNLFRGQTNYDTFSSCGENLMKNFPQIKDYCRIYNRRYKYSVRIDDGEIQEIEGMQADTMALRFFNVKTLEGSIEHLNEKEAMLTHSLAKKLFGRKSAVGEQISCGADLDRQDPDKTRYTVVAVVDDCPDNTQFPFEVILPFEEQNLQNGFGFYTFLRLHENADLDSIVEKKISYDQPMVYHSWNGEPVEWSETQECILVPLRKLRTDFPPEDIKISTDYVRWFMGIGLLVILCSLCNYIITMLNHLRRRAWEMSLRRVLGASIKTILAMVSTEALITFVLAAFFGWFITWAALPFFREYSCIEIPLSSIFWKICGYLMLVILAGLILSAFTAWIVMKKTQANILGARQIKHSSTNLDRIGVTIQLALSMGIIFAVTIMFRQVNFLMYSDELGFDHRNCAVVLNCPEDLKEYLSESAAVEEICSSHETLFPRMMYSEMYVSDETGAITITAQRSNIVEENVKFYRISLLAGDYPYNLADGQMDGMHGVCVNEALMRKMHWTQESAIGQTLYQNGMPNLRVCGVIKDIYLLGPTVQPTPEIYFYYSYEELEEELLYHNKLTLFRTKPDLFEETMDSVMTKIRRAYEAGQDLRVSYQNTSEEFNKYITAEQMLIKILLVVALCSLFVCVLGAFSLVSLSLTERRKEIAIRKAHGAHISDILQLFLRSHYLSLAIAALIAYPLSYIIMRNWLEHYTKQVGVDWWIIPATFLLISLVVIATISLKIYFAAKEKAARALA